MVLILKTILHPISAALFKKYQKSRVISLMIKKDLIPGKVSI